MKTLAVLLALASFGCAHTTIYSPQSGRVVCKVDADAAIMSFVCRPDGSIQFYARDLSHSKATKAQQDGMAKVSTAMLMQGEPFRRSTRRGDDLRNSWGITVTNESDLQGVIDQIYATAASEISAAGTLAQVKTVYVKQVGLLFRLIIYLFRVLR